MTDSLMNATMVDFGNGMVEKMGTCPLPVSSFLAIGFKVGASRTHIFQGFQRFGKLATSRWHWASPHGGNGAIDGKSLAILAHRWEKFGHFSPTLPMGMVDFYQWGPVAW